MMARSQGGAAAAGPALAAAVARRRAPRPAVGRVATAVLVVMGGWLVGCSGSTASPYQPQKFVPHYPKFLPKRTLDAHVDQVLLGTSARPALSVEGEPVRVETAGWSVLADVVGPSVPVHGAPFQPVRVASTWTITLSRATGTVPLSVHDFNTLDHLGNISWPTYLTGQPPLPAVLRPGQTLSFQVRANETVGEGIMRWAPINQRIVAMWDFTVETD